MSKIGFAIVGCGNIAPFHAEAIRDTEGAELVAVCNTNEKRAGIYAGEKMVEKGIERLREL